MSRRRGDPSVDGVVVIDKPGGMTSYDVIRRLKRTLGTPRLGHTGTLDPMATGILVVCAGWSTRLVPFLSDGWKTYTGTIRLGVRTDTDDLDGCVVEERSVAVDRAQVESAFSALVGAIMQRPPAVSALKVDGERAYARVRRGEEVELAAREVEVLEFEVTGFEGVDVSFVATVSSGTYIRSLARDVGEALGCGASLAVLRRTMNAPFGEERALVLESVCGPEDLISPWEALAGMPEAFVSDLAVSALRQGRAIEWEGGPVAGENVRVAGESSPGELVAIARYDAGAMLLHPVRVRPLPAGTSPGG